MVGWWWQPSRRQDDGDDSAQQTPASSDLLISADPNPSATDPKLVTVTPSASSSSTAPSIRKAAKARITAQERDEAALEELRSLFTSGNSSDPLYPTRTKDTLPPDDYADSLYPTRLSCTQCFDAAFYCSSVGGQLNNIYRYGGMRSCGDLWRQWRFCMRTKAMSEEEKKMRVREWWREKEAKRRMGRNSEEVWELRGVDDIPSGALVRGTVSEEER